MLRLVEIQVMTEARLRVDPRHARLARIEFPRMEVEDRRPSFELVHPLDQPARDRIGHEPEIAAAAGGPVALEEARRADWHLEQVLALTMREARRIRNAVVVVLDGVDARAVPIARLRDAVVGPTVRAVDREARRPIAEHLRAGDVLQDALREHDVSEERVAVELVRLLVGVAVARDLVAGCGDAPHEPRKALSDPAQREERRARVGVGEELQDEVDIALYPARRLLPLRAQDVRG